jgi:hypothetical protein
MTIIKPKTNPGKKRRMLLTFPLQAFKALITPAKFSSAKVAAGAGPGIFRLGGRSSRV